MRGWGRGTSRRRAAAHRWDALFPPDDAPPGLLDLGASDDAAASAEPADPAADPAADPEAGAEPGDPGGAHGSARGQAADAPTRRREDRPRLAVSVRLGAVLTLLLAAACASWWGIAHGAAPTAVPVDAPPPRTGSADPRAPGPQTPSGSPVPANDGPTVHVAGAVLAPGVYRLAPGARVHEAIAAAGGAKPGADLDRLNLAAPVEDGTRLKVPLRGDPEDAQASGGGAAAPGAAAPRQTGGAAAGGSGLAGKVDLNTATAEDLGALPRVGPVLAQRIVDYRTAHGRFTAPEDLDAVSGIGPKMLESLLPLVTVG
ncbi:helix-hairpin-helix domain-containing protein [Sinomonas atrocyanea]|uniref:helix-hairpin-helix domain-containing protein n=1 Tax=Sinomonas atrocyanea TaxID=37927 RepID=UPI0008319D8A|nr:helix-hairpin-helix domain-containing protein [Sinomonas atrocyanea]